jgi:hypothetical protein
MPAGLECYNADGTLQWSSLTSRIITVLMTIQTGKVNGSRVVPGLANRDGVALKCSQNIGYYPEVVLSGTTVSWSFDAAWPTDKRSDTLITVLGF